MHVRMFIDLEITQNNDFDLLKSILGLIKDYYICIFIYSTASYIPFLYILKIMCLENNNLTNYNLRNI